MLTYLLKHDRIERPRRGVYHIPQVPATRFDGLRLALLWTGNGEAVLSHETALELYDVCDIVPDLIHVTVPLAHRIAKSDADVYAVHRERITAEEKAWVEELPVVTLAKAIDQCIDAGTPIYLVRQAIKGGLAKGLITKDMATGFEKDIDG